MEVLGWGQNDFNLASHGLVGLEKFHSENHRPKKKKKRVEIFNIRNPICSFFAPSAYTNITNAGRLPGEDADSRVHDF